MKDFTNGELEKTRQFAKSIGCLEQFENTLKRLCIREENENVGNQGRKSHVELYPDFAPHSFFWVWRETESQRVIMNGGIIYHGKHDNHGSGGAPTYSVCIDPSDKPEWRIHT